MPLRFGMVPMNGIGTDGWAHREHTAPTGTDPVPLYQSYRFLSRDNIFTTGPHGRRVSHLHSRDGRTAHCGSGTR